MNVYSQIQDNKIRSILIIGIFILLMSVLFYFIGQYVGDPLVFFIIGVSISFISGFISYFYSDKIVLKMAGARPVNKDEFFDYYTVAENLSIAAGIPMPKLYVIDDEAMNAFATGRNPENAVVAATTGLLRRLDRSDIEGVVAHELSHIKNYDILVMTIVTVLVGTIAYTVDFAMRTFMFGGGRRDRNAGGFGVILFLVFLILVPIISMLIQFAVSRKREYLADASGVLLTRNPEGLASALEKISSDSRRLRNASSATAHLYIANPLKKESGLKNSLSRLFSTHPPAEERIKILRSMAGNLPQSV